jgi:pseudouridine synthase
VKERLQKLLAQANIGSRRASEDLIERGRVRVNGAVAKLGDQADPDLDVIEVDGVRLSFASRERIFIALNKPKHVLTTDKPHRTDQRQTVMDFIDRKEHLFSIGRLDADSEGLVVMTNDGETALRLTHPRYRHSKTYRVEVHGLPSLETLEKWRDGIFLEEGKTAPCFVEIVKGSVKGTTLRIVMTEGKKRQIRRVATALGHPVQRLVRTHIGAYALSDLAPGATRTLSAKDILALSTPAPEIKGLRAQPKRKKRDESDPEKGVEDGRTNPRTRDAKSREEDGRTTRAPRTPTSESKWRTTRASADDGQDEKPRRRTPVTASYEDSGDKPRVRRSPRTEAAGADGDKPSARRTPRGESSVEGESEKPRFRRPARSGSTDTSTGKPRVRRARPDAGNSPDAPRKPRRKPSTESSSEDEKRPERTRKVYPPRKNSTDVHRQRKQGNRKKTRK